MAVSLTHNGRGASVSGGHDLPLTLLEEASSRWSSGRMWVMMSMARSAWNLKGSGRGWGTHKHSSWPKHLMPAQTWREKPLLFAGDKHFREHGSASLSRWRREGWVIVFCKKLWLLCCKSQNVDNRGRPIYPNWNESLCIQRGVRIKW